jgi:hypothetical protein
MPIACPKALVPPKASMIALKVSMPSIATLCGDHSQRGV